MSGSVVPPQSCIIHGSFLGSACPVCSTSAGGGWQYSTTPIHPDDPLHLSRRLAECEARLEASERVRRQLAEALRNMEEPCPDCDGDGCDWCGHDGFILVRPEDIVRLRNAALDASDALDKERVDLREPSTRTGGPRAEIKITDALDKEAT